MTIWGWVVANWEILSAVLDGTNTTKKTTTQTSGDTYAAGDSLDVEVTTVSWTPTTADAVAWLEVEET